MKEWAEYIAEVIGDVYNWLDFAASVKDVEDGELTARICNAAAMQLDERLRDWRTRQAQWD